MQKILDSLQLYC